MLYYSRGSKNDSIGPEELRKILYEVFKRLGPKKRVLAIPCSPASIPSPDRLPKWSGIITEKP